MSTIKVNTIQSTTGGLVSIPQGLQYPDGTAASPSISFSSDTGTGFYRIGTNVLGMSAGGSQIARIDSQGLKVIDGTAAAPSLSFSADTITGVYKPGVNRLGFAANGTAAGEFNGTDFKFNSGYGSVGTAYGCRAWANYAGTTLNAGGNVSSITTPAGGGTGWRQVNFTTSMPNANYAVTLAVWPNGSYRERPCVAAALNVAFVVIHNRDVGTGDFYDSPVYMAVHR